MIENLYELTNSRFFVLCNNFKDVSMLGPGHLLSTSCISMSIYSFLTYKYFVSIFNLYEATKL